MKEFDVHFNVSFSDMLTGIEANSAEEAKDKALEMLAYELADMVTNQLESDFDSILENVMTTDVLEVGKDI